MSRSIACLYAFVLILSTITGTCLAQSTLNIQYNSIDGSLSADPNPKRMSAHSTAGYFTGEPEVLLGDIYDNFFAYEGFFEPDRAAELGPIVSPGLTAEQLLNDLCISAVTQEGSRFESILINGAELHSSPAKCERIRRPFPALVDGVTALMQNDTATGNLEVFGDPPLSTLEIGSKSGIFTGQINDRVVLAPFDVNRPDKLFVLRPNGVSGIDFGPVAREGMTNNEFLADICVNGSVLPAGKLDVEYAYPDGGTVPIRNCVNGPTNRNVTVDVKYGESSGELAVDTSYFQGKGDGVKRGTLMTTLDIRSTSGVFVDHESSLLAAELSVSSPFRLLLHDDDGFESANFGAIVASGLNAGFLHQDLTIDATFSDHHAIREIKVNGVPEPNMLSWVLAAFAAVISVARKRG